MATPSKARGVREGEGGGLVTDEIRIAYVYAQQVVNGHVNPDANPGAVFDRWLAQHDAEVAGRALRGAADTAWANRYSGASAALRKHAARVEARS